MDSNYNLFNYSSFHKKKTKEEIIQDRILKDRLVSSGYYDLWRNIQFAENSKRLALFYGTDMFKKYEIYLGAELPLTAKEVKMCKQIYNAKRARDKRLRLYIDLALSGYDCVFLTLTFEPKVLDNTSHDTRRAYIRRYCKNLGSTFYCANIDFGDKDKNIHSKGREHYHALVNLPRIDLSEYPYGYIYAEKVHKSSKPEVLAKYIDKLTKHAYKDSTKGRDRIIYSRKKFY